VRYDLSSLWKIHDAYFAARGGAAWSQGEIPSMATSSYAMARQQAKLLLALVKELEEQGALARNAEVGVLEVGAGSGRFAAMFLRALERGCGEAGKALFPRIRYTFTDYSRANVRDALQDHPELAHHAKAGRLRPGILDLRNPRELCGLEGEPLPG